MFLWYTYFHVDVDDETENGKVAKQLNSQTPEAAPSKLMTLDEAVQYLGQLDDNEEVFMFDEDEVAEGTEEITEIINAIDETIDDIPENDLLGKCEQVICIFSYQFFAEAIERLPSDVNFELEGDDGGSFPGGFKSYLHWSSYRSKYLVKGVGHIFCRDGLIICDTCLKYQKYVRLAELCKSTKGIGKNQAFLDGVVTKDTRSANKAINKHCDSQFHLACVEIKKTRGNGTIKKLFVESEKRGQDLRTKRQQIMGRILSTAYYAVKMNIAYRNHGNLVNMQSKHGLEMGTMLFSEKSLKAMVAHISSEMRVRLLKKIQEEQVNIYIFINEILLLSFC